MRHDDSSPRNPARHRRRRGALATVVATAALSLAIAPAASAATTTAWASWDPLAGTGGNYTSSMTLAGQPTLTATITSDSLGGGGIGVISGASTWLSDSTPIGAEYGSSRNQPYLNLRPQANSAASPSTTTYTFDTPAPASGWAFALGDIDADSLRISGTTATGAALTAADLGFRDAFNYCDPGVGVGMSCAGYVGDVPTWDPATLTLMGNPTAADTAGAAAWFEPTVSISTLTFEYSQRSGFPIYQTWFASMARDITGTVSDVEDGPLDGVALSLTDANGAVVATTTTSGGGLYSFPGFFATDGYQVTATPPPGKVGVVATGTADLRTADAVVDLTVRDIASLDGTVTAAGSGIGGVTVTATGPGGTLTTTTAADGTYSFPLIGDGTYDVAITVPAGTVAVTPATRNETVAGTDLTGIDFELARLGSISGTITDSDGDPLDGVTVSLDGPAGTTTATSGADGTYSIGDLPPGTYDISVIAPDGYTVDGPAVVTATITASGDVIVDRDFALIADPVAPVDPIDPPAPTVPPPGQAPGSSGSGPLAVTGADSSPFIVAGAIALLGGGLLLAIGRRRLQR
ncbi:carboxypeptidase regulatory-like domain-containing protein [Microbacterium sp. AGC85]